MAHERSKPKPIDAIRPARLWRPGLGRSIAVLAWLALSSTSSLHAQKTDTVALRNGDVVTGEIKRLSRGKLEYSTDDMGTVYIKWERVRLITSNQILEVEVRSGRKYFGTLELGADSGLVVVDALTRKDTLNIASVVLITPIKATFVERLKAYIDLGFTLTKANDQVELTTSGEVRYRGRKWGDRLAFSSYFRNQTGASTSRNSLQLDVGRFFARKWTAVGFTQWQQNDEISLDLRTTLGAGADRNLIHTNHVDLALIGGLLGAREQYQNDTTATYSVEAQAVVRIEAFRFDDPEIDLSAKLAAYPSLTDLGRVRSQLEARIRFEVIKKLFLGLNGFVYYDTRPPSEGVDKEDYAVTLTVGWSYN
ncbi:MAG: DUF481 domain-containing protein [Gemmatimonadota bacterium]